MIPTAALALALAASLGAPQEPAEPYRKLLTSVGENLRVESWRLDATDLGVAVDAGWSVEKLALHGGRQEGVDLIVLDNGRLRIRVVPTRGMSILDVTAGDVRLGWDSPVKEVVHPRTIDLELRGGLGWLEGFNEWLVRCGLEYAGHPGTDRFVDNVGNESAMELTLHGRIGNLPASEVMVLVDRQPPHRIRVRGRVDERSFYGPQLELWAEVSTLPGEDGLRIEDAVTNRGPAEQEFQVIYHANFGPPLLEEGARFHGALERVTPFNDRAAEGLESFDVYPAPRPGFVEQVYCLRPWADEDGASSILLANAAADLAVSMTWPRAQLPYVTLWKNALSRAGGYVTGLEPGTGFPANRGVERAAGRVPTLAPGQTRRFTLDVQLHEGAEEVAAAITAVEAVGADRPTQVDRQPEPRPQPSKQSTR